MRKIFIFLLAILPFLSSSQINWEQTNGPEGATGYFTFNTKDYAFFPNHYYLYRSADGSEWEKLSQGDLYPIGYSDSTIVGITGNNYRYLDSTIPIKLIISHNNGTSWKDCFLPTKEFQYFSSITYHEGKIYLPDGYGDYIYTTEDEGLSWDSIVAPFRYTYDIYIRNNELYAGNFSNLAKYNQITNLWETITFPIDTERKILCGFYIDDNISFFAFETAIYSSLDGGATWSIKVGEFFADGNPEFVKIKDRIYFQGGYKLLYTENNGLSWTTINRKIEDGFIISLAQINDKLLVSTYDNIFKFDENNDQFIKSESGLHASRVNNLNCNSKSVFATTPLGLYNYHIKDLAWSKINLPFQILEEGKTLIYRDSLVIHFGLFEPKTYLSKDYGNTWDTIVTPDDIFWFNFNYYWVDNILYGVNKTPNVLIKSIDFGKTWERIQSNIPVIFDAVLFKGRNFGINNNGIYVSVDSGVKWNKINTPFERAGYIFMAQDKIFIYSLYEPSVKSGLYMSEDGINWQYAGEGLPQFDGDSYYSNKKIWKLDEKYFVYDPSLGLFVSIDNCRTWLPVESNLWQLCMCNNTFYTNKFQSGVQKSGIPNSYGTLVSGIVYHDLNNNGIFDVSEKPLKNISVSVNENNIYSGFWSDLTNEYGKYSLGISPGNIGIVKPKIQTNIKHTFNPGFHNAEESGSDYNFGVHFSEYLTNAYLNGTLFGRPRPGFNLNLNLTYGNIGSLSLDGTISVKLDPKYEFLSADPLPSKIVGNDSIVWNIADLNLFEKKLIKIEGKVSVDAVLGNPLKVNGHFIVNNDIDNFNNHFSISDTIVGSFDPNEKLVFPVSGLSKEEIENGKEITYTILFQNTGTYYAEKVRILDQLDTALQLQTIKFVDASHKVTKFEVRPGGLLQIEFDSIFLVDSLTNEPESHGFVSFAIQRKKSYNPTFRINNTANIYFDYNAPIVTNTVVTKLFRPETPSFTNNSGNLLADFILCFPNPSNDFLFINSLDKKLKIKNVKLLNSQGRILANVHQSFDHYELKVKTSDYPDGIYFISILVDDEIYTKKIVVKH